MIILLHKIRKLPQIKSELGTFEEEQKVTTIDWEPIMD